MKIDIKELSFKLILFTIGLSVSLSFFFGGFNQIKKILVGLPNKYEISYVTSKEISKYTLDDLIILFKIFYTYIGIIIIPTGGVLIGSAILYFTIKYFLFNKKF